jgi:hypothetical protein
MVSVRSKFSVNLVVVYAETRLIGCPRGKRTEETAREQKQKSEPKEARSTTRDLNLSQEFLLKMPVTERFR